MPKLRVVIDAVSRLPNSKSGNPRWWIHMSLHGDGMTWRRQTKPDTPVGHQVTPDLVGKLCDVTVHRQQVTEISVVTESDTVSHERSE